MSQGVFKNKGVSSEVKPLVDCGLVVDGEE